MYIYVISFINSIIRRCRKLKDILNSKLHKNFQLDDISIELLYIHLVITFFKLLEYSPIISHKIHLGFVDRKLTGPVFRNKGSPEKRKSSFSYVSILLLRLIKIDI